MFGGKLNLIYYLFFCSLLSIQNWGFSIIFQLTVLHENIRPDNWVIMLADPSTGRISAICNQLLQLFVYGVCYRNFKRRCYDFIA
jgi:hypothetical protein